MSAVGQFLRRVKATGARRPGTVETVAMGRARAFVAYDAGPDTFVFEEGIAGRLRERPSVLIVPKRSLGRRTRGYVMTLTTGNHSVAAFPLLDGRFWKLSVLPADRRSDVLRREIVCANVVGPTIELSQREVPTARLVGADAWLREAAGFGLGDIVMAERDDATIDHFRRLGQEWRVKPLAWTGAEMRAALAASRKRIATTIAYYHSTRGVHFITLAEFRRFAARAESRLEDFVRALRELVGVYEGNVQSFARLPKYRGHHEIEFFGIRRGLALERLVPALESLLASVSSGCADRDAVIRKAREAVSLYESMLSRPELGDEESAVFVETLYMYITGEIYSVVGEGSTPAFDDRRTALPGATFVGGVPAFHPGRDPRTEILLTNLGELMSKDEIIEYANVYELRSEDETAPLGRGKTREVVYKTNLGPLEHSLVEKRLSRAARGYGGYMLARVGALKALGIALSDYRLLRRRSGKGMRPVDFYIRRRCEGEPMEAIPRNYFLRADGSSAEEREVVLSLAMLMGDAAAQNMAMKKYDPATQSPLYGVGKEIYEFEYDIVAKRVMPKRVSICSMRSSFGWPNLSFDAANLRALGAFYLAHYAHALKDFQRRHGVGMTALARRFMDGFAYRTHALAWQLSVMRDKFEAFAPDVPGAFAFAAKWRFAMGALERQEQRLAELRKLFYEKVKVVEDESLRSHPESFRIVALPR